MSPSRSNASVFPSGETSTDDHVDSETSKLIFVVLARGVLMSRGGILRLRRCRRRGFLLRADDGEIERRSEDSGGDGAIVRHVREYNGRCAGHLHADAAVRERTAASHKRDHRTSSLSHGDTSEQADAHPGARRRDRDVDREV